MYKAVCNFRRCLHTLYLSSLMLTSSPQVSTLCSCSLDSKDGRHEQSFADICPHCHFSRPNWWGSFVCLPYYSTWITSNQNAHSQNPKGSRPDLAKVLREPRSSVYLSKIETIAVLSWAHRQSWSRVQSNPNLVLKLLFFHTSIASEKTTLYPPLTMS